MSKLGSTGVSGRKPERSAEKSSFSVTCSLLSQYIKEKGSFGDLSLGMVRSFDDQGKSETFRPPTTMSLLPGADISGERDSETKDEVSERNATKSMDLFPLVSGFVTSVPADDAVKKTDSRETENAQLTIFYGGKVLVFDNFTAEKAKELMQMASKGIPSTAQNFGFAPPPPTSFPATAVTVVAGGGSPADWPNGPSQCNSTLTSTSENLPADAQDRSQKPVQPNSSDLPIMRKASLHRFLEKRKDRIKSKAPYEVDGMGAGSSKPDGSHPWLGLYPQVSKPGSSSHIGGR